MNAARLLKIEVPQNIYMEGSDALRQKRSH